MSTEYDLAHWKPCTPDQFLHELAELYHTLHLEGGPISLECEMINGPTPNGRVRMVAKTYLYTLDATPEERNAQDGEPSAFLMAIVDTQKKKNNLFVRTDREPAYY